MKCYAQPYEGEKPYLFFSYCHKDAPKAYPIIERLSIDGFRVWFDDGLHPGDDWPDVVAEHLYSGAVCLIAVSEAYAASHNCKNELTYAVNHNKQIVSVVLEQFKMPKGISLQIGSANYLNLFDFSDDPEAFYARLEASPLLAACREKDHLTNHYALSEWKKHSAEYAVPEKKKPSEVGKGWLLEPLHIEQEPPEKPSGETPDVPKTSLEEEKTEVKKPSGPSAGGEDLDQTTVKKHPGADPEGEDPLETTAVKNGDPLNKTTRRKPIIVPTIAVLVHISSGSIFRMKTGLISIGRDPFQSDFVIDNPYIGRRHADIQFIEGRFFLKDNDSTNGTFYDGQKLGEDPEEKPVELKALDWFSLDEERFLFVSGENVKRLLSMEAHGSFATLKAQETGEERLLDEKVFLFSRKKPWKDGVLAGEDVSREHAVILMKEDGYYIRDTGSTNGTFINGEQLVKGKRAAEADPDSERKLQDGDTVSISDVPFLFSLYALHQSESKEEKP